MDEQAVRRPRDRAGNVYGAQVPGQTLVKYERIR